MLQSFCVISMISTAGARDINLDLDWIMVVLRVGHVGSIGTPIKEV